MKFPGEDDRIKVYLCSGSYENRDLKKCATSLEQEVCIMIGILLLSRLLLWYSASSAQQTQPVELAGEVGLIAVLSDDHILCEARTDVRTGLFSLNLDNRDMVPWEPDWSPEEEGWNTGGYWDLDVSPDGEWVLVARLLYVTEDFEYFIPGREAVGLILCRPDGTDARGIALGWSPAGGGIPKYYFTSDSKLISGNNIVCEFMNPEAFATDVYGEYTRDIGTVSCFNLETMSLEKREYPTGNGEHILYPCLSVSYLRCQWNDLAIFFEQDGGNLCEYFEFRSLSMDGSVTVYEVQGEYPSGGYGIPRDWVTEEAVLFNQADTLGLLHTNGTFTALPDSTWDWFVYGFLPDSSCIFSRDNGETVEHGLINWEDFEVLSSRPRQDLRNFTGYRMTCLGKEDMLLSSKWSTGPLYLTRREEF